jgi:pyrroline-5-carboxylate reductase
MPITRSGRLVAAASVEIGIEEVFDRFDAVENLVGVGPALVGELAEALAHRLEAALDGFGSSIV